MDKLLELAKAFVKDYYQEGLFLIFTNILTGFFAVRNSRKTISLEYQKELGKKIATALTQARGLVKATNEMEAYTEKALDNLPMDANSFKKTPYYPSFMASKKTLIEFVEKLSQCRNDCDEYLDLECSGYLYVLEKYFLNMSLFLQKYKIVDTEIVGCVAICDIQKWGKEFDALLVKQLNRSHHRLYSKQGKRWEKVKKRLEFRYLHQSVLVKFINLHEQNAIPDAD